MPDTIALDIHTHLVPIVPERLAALSGISWDSAAERLTLDGHHLGLMSLFRPSALLAWMDTNRIARAWISVPPPL